MITAKARYTATVDGDCTLDYMIQHANNESISGIRTTDRKFEDALKYDITRTIINIMANATIRYAGTSDKFCLSLQKNLSEIYYKLYEFGKCYVKIDEQRQIIDIRSTLNGVNKAGYIDINDDAFIISGITQKEAAKRALDMYGVITNAMFSVIDERGLLGIFSPAKDTVIKQNQIEKVYESFRTLFGTKRGQRKFAIVDVPLTYSGVTIPIKDMELIANKKDATATAARIFGIQEDMILSGSTFDNKENAIIQTYTDYAGLIYNYIVQIESKLISLNRNIESYEVTFPSVPQMNKPKIPQTI